MQGDEALLFGETAVAHGFITRDQLQAALDACRGRADPRPLGSVLVELGLITPPQATAIEKLKAVKELQRAGGPAPDADGPAAEDDPPLTGMTLGGCLVLDRIGTGSMGTAYRAHHLRLDRDVVVKVLHPRLVAIPGNLERFAREARAAAALEHPAIVSIYDFDADDGYHFIVMQHVDGQNLRQVLSTRGARGARRGLWVAARVLEGLSHAHQKGIVHRDIKPANLIITREPRIKIADFGLVRILSLSTSEKISVFGEILGTPQYMAPEQATCDDVDGRTDLYSLGVSLFELIAGRPPFTGDSTFEVLERQIMEPLPDLRELVPDATEDVQRFLETLAAKDPDARFPSADAALAALQALRTPDRGTTQRLVSRGGLAEGATADPSRNVEAPPIVSEAALDELKRRLRASRQFVAFEVDGAEAPPPEPEPSSAGRKAAIEETFAGTADPTSSVLRRARARIERATAEGAGEKVIPELLLGLLEGGHVDELLALERDLDRALPTSAAVAFFLGLAHERKGKLEDARAKLALAAVLAPDHLPARLHLAKVLVRLERVDEAVQTLQEANRWHPTSVQAATRLAEVLFVVKRDAAAAVPAYERAIELAPNRWQLRQQLALALEQLDRLGEAEAVLEEVAAWRKDAPQVVELLAQVRRKRKKRQLLAEVDRASETETGEPGPETSARLSAIRLASAGNKWERALKVAQDGLSERPRSVPLLIAAGRAQAALGQLSDAVESFGLALAVDPHNEEAQQGLVETQEARRRERGR
ncbi:MAG: protein kinase [Planctomycetes bacterium]|nr:protein kinase [Planctomycetota bacterium]